MCVCVVALAASAPLRGGCQALLQAAEAVPCSVLPWAFFFGCKPSVPVTALGAPSDLLSKVKANSWMQCDSTLV